MQENRLKTVLSLELKPEEYQEYLDFMRGVIEKNFRDRIDFILDILYGSRPGILARLSFPETVVEVRVLAGERPEYMVEAIEGYMPLSLRTTLEKLIEGASYVFSETRGRGVLYYVFVPGHDVIPARSASIARKITEKLLSGNLVFMFAISLLLYYLVFMIVGFEYTPIALAAVQFLLVTFSYRISGMLGDWDIDEKHSTVYLVGVELPLDVYDEMVNGLLYPRRYEIKRLIYDSTIGKEGDVKPEVVAELLNNYGVSIDPGNITIKKVDLYDMAKKVFTRYGLPVPRISLANIVLPNASATGIIKSKASLLVTTGLLTRLSDEEVMAILGHEASHVKNHDTLLLYVLSMLEYSLRIYIFLNFLYLFNIFTELLYFYLSLTALFFVAKFIEARADIETAKILGDGRPLASALRKLGYSKIMREASPGERLRSWLRLDPHPPASFRVEKLSSINPHVVKGVWREAIASCLSDFIRTLSLAKSGQPG